MGVGNGLGSGIVMTLGADAAPTVGRAPFLGVWRLLSLVGHNGAALVVGAVAAVATIGVASVTVGLLTLAGGAWLARWLPEYDPRARAESPSTRSEATSGQVGRAARWSASRVSPGKRRLAYVTDLIDTTEMYLRTIFELEEEGIRPLRARIAERLGQSGPTVSQTVARMERDGLLHVEGDRHLELTDQGRLLATRVMRKHRLAERLLVDVIGLEWEFVHDEACRWEHVMSETVERRILAMLPDHAESPYGNPIPGLDELGDLTVLADFRYGLTTLDVIAATEPATVVVRRIGEPVQVDSEALALLTAAGLMPGQPARVRRDGARVIACRDGAEESSGVSLPDDIASHVFVQAT